MGKVWIILLIVVIIIAGFAIFFISQNRGDSLQNNIANNPSSNSYSVEVQSKLAICSKVSDSYVQYECYANLAKEVKDSSICQQVSTDISYIVSKRDDCYETYALTLSDLSACNHIESTDVKADCYAGISKDSTYCLSIQNSEIKDSCYFNIARETGDSSMCSKIVGSNAKTNCYNLVD